MSNSSAQSTYSITLNDTTDYSYSAQDVITLTDTITVTGAGSGYFNVGAGAVGTSGGYTTITNGGTISDTITLDPSIFSWNNEEWVDAFPQWARIQDMCDRYPGLKIAFEKFKTTYKLVKDDYDNPNDKK